MSTRTYEEFIECMNHPDFIGVSSPVCVKCKDCKKEFYVNDDHYGEWYDSNECPWCHPERYGYE